MSGASVRGKAIGFPLRAAPLAAAMIVSKIGTIRGASERDRDDRAGSPVNAWTPRQTTCQIHRQCAFAEET